jgi:hypothetical protein
MGNRLPIQSRIARKIFPGECYSSPTAIRPSDQERVMESFVRNCVLQARVLGEVVPGRVPDTETLFRVNERGECLAYLDGYAIVPKEEWERLQTQASR